LPAEILGDSDLGSDFVGGELVDDAMAAQDLVGLAAADAEEFGELAVGKLALLVETDGHGLTGGVIELTYQEIV
jgi:hypothetical protein